MGKGNGTTRASASSSPKGLSRNDNGGGRLRAGSSKIAAALERAKGLPDIRIVESMFNAYSGDMLYNFTYRNTGFDYDEGAQLRIQDADGTDGTSKLGEYRIVRLPESGNGSIRQATNDILNSLPKGTKLQLEVEAGTRDERNAKRYGFEEVPGSLTREDWGGYYKTYRRIIK